MYTKKEHIHLVGIGGIGMSGIATVLRMQGYTVSGCDNDIHQQSIYNLTSLGCSVFEGNNTPSCADKSITIVVYSTAIKQDNPEIIRAKNRGIFVIHRAQMLAEIMRTKYSIAITGSHGKTTTSSLVSHILLETGIDPTILVGGHLTKIGTNATYGHGDFLVAEADESDRSLTTLNPSLALITNISLEHLETYTDLDDIKKTFTQFLDKLPFYGAAFLCADDPQLKEIVPEKIKHIITYGISSKADFFADTISLFPTHSTYFIHHKKTGECGQAIINMPGIHNVQNSVGALAIAHHIGIPLPKALNALASFEGVDRRFSYRGISKQGAELFDDYGHHPLEIEKTLIVAKKRTKNKLIVAFQPHRFTRTKALWNQFVQVLATAPIDHLIVTDIYPASETPLEGINSERLAQEISLYKKDLSIQYIPLDTTFKTIKEHLEKNATHDDLILIQGAGNLYKITHLL